MPPNLYTPADGLFGTHVTWEDCEEDMQRELDTMASFGPNKTAKDIGDGNVSCSAFLSKSLISTSLKAIELLNSTLIHIIDRKSCSR
ncbi:unnamed protein product [Haemonchus placei]|uniref:Ribonuclease H-like domain-containing protein n=1 Tax=Haemonchus placei TaxID=6290 RepID=A0A0N4X3W3_HAEPC|nr:unnamed protein product [Haemonchus placei]